MNWNSLIAELRAAGLTRADIAAMAECGVSTIADLEMIENRQPRHDLGQRLIALHAQHTNSVRKKAA